MTMTLVARLRLKERCLACNRLELMFMCRSCAELTLAEDRAKGKEQGQDVYPDGTVAWPSNY